MTASILAAPAVIFALALFSSPASAHDFWINWGGYKSPIDGSHCCGDHDCQAIPAEQVQITSKGYALMNGELVPYSETQESEDGQYWRCRRYDGSRRCFFAPQPSS